MLKHQTITFSEKGITEKWDPGPSEDPGPYEEPGPHEDPRT